MLRRVLTLLLITALLISGCSSSDGSDDASDRTEPVEREGPEASILPPATDPNQPVQPDQELEEQPPENADDGRLVVQDAAFQLSTMLPDGSEVTELTDPGTINTQANWAPDGSRVAWVAVDAATGDASVASDRFDRSDFRAVDVESAPFYLYWDPSAARIANLGPSRGGIDLSVAEMFAEDGPVNRRIDRGQPYFFSGARRRRATRTRVEFPPRPNRLGGVDDHHR